MVQNNEITITIDGVQVKTRPGKMVLEAAIDAGIYVPYLCYHPGMKPYAACRMCVVEVADDGRGNSGRGFPASCTLPVADKMVIKSAVTHVDELRRNVMDLLLAEHPHGCLTCHRVDLCGPEDVCLRHVSVNDRCVTCPKNERCELKDTVRYLGMNLESPLNYRYRKLPIEVGDPFYDRDYNLCIVCVRCVRVCEEVRGDNALTVIERSGKALVGTAFGTSLLESGCEFCGACVDVCPVGALVESDHKWEKARRVERTVCPQCPVGCQLNLEVNSFGRMIRSIPEINAPANRGQACFKGKFGLDFVNDKTRLKRPMVRRNGKLEETTWDEALGVMVQRLGGYREDTFALLTSPNSTNEEQYLSQKFARAVMGTNNVDQTSNTRPGLVEGLADTLGYRAATNNIWELEGAQCIIAFNTNLTEEQNVVGVPVKRAVKKGTKLIVIDPREVELTRYTGMWLRPKPGTELLLLGGILKEVLAQGLEKKDWIEKSVQGIDALKQSLASVNVDDVTTETGVPKEQIQEAAKVYGSAATGAILYALDNIPASLHKDCVSALTALALVTGNIGKPSTGIYPMRQGANEQGAWDVGGVPYLLPGYEAVSDAAARTKFQRVWKLPVPQSQGLGVVEAFEAMWAKKVKALFLIGDSPNFTNGLLGDGIGALKSLEFLVVMDSFLTEAAQQAHVVLPRATFAEKSGTFTNIERRVQTVRPVIAPKNLDAKPEWWVICELARRMQADGFGFESPAQVMDEIASLTPIYGGVSHQRLEKEARLVLRPDVSNPLPNQVLYSDKEYKGLQWPCPDVQSKGTAVLYSEGFTGGKARVIAPQFRRASLGEGLVFVPGRVLLQSEREMEVVKGKQNRIVREEVIEINPQDAAPLGIREGDAVKVQVNGHSIQGRAALRESLQRGTVASTMLFGQMMSELDASEDPDPMAKAPTLLIKPAKLAKI